MHGEIQVKGIAHAADHRAPGEELSDSGQPAGPHPAGVEHHEEYERYKSANAVPFRKYGGRFIVRGGRFKCLAGQARERHVVIEFDSYETALACYNSPEYRDAQKYQASSSENDIIIIEGI